MRQEIDIEKLAALPTYGQLLDAKYGEVGMEARDSFEERGASWYYAQMLKDERKAQGMTQLQLAEKIGKKREYVAALEKGDIDMQLSTFVALAGALGLELRLVRPGGYVKPSGKYYLSDGEQASYGDK